MKKFYFFVGLIPVLLLLSCPIPSDGLNRSLIDSLIYSDPNGKSTAWTIMYYVDADNDLESYLLDDIYELSQGMESTEIVNVIALVDRISGYSADSAILGSNFTDTKLFRIGADEIYPLEGGGYFSDIGMAKSGEYNMGDGETLKTFIEYCKAYYPADNYALIFTNHGGGVKGSSEISQSIAFGSGLVSNVLPALVEKAICYDSTSGDDSLSTAEITNILDNRHSVDLMVYDACVMGLLEIAYQYRPESAGGDAGEFSADYMVASVPNVWGYGLPYDRIFSRLSESKTGDAGHDSTVVNGSSYPVQYFDPSTMSGEDFGRIIVEEQEWDTQHVNSTSAQSFSLYNLDYSDDVVDAFDDLSSGNLKSTYNSTTLQNLRSAIGSGLTYSDYVAYPHFDLYALALNRSDSALQTAVNNMVAASFGDFSGFSVNGKHGLGFFFTDGNASYTSSSTGETKTAWAWQYWYTGESFGASVEYGQLAFCKERSGFTTDNVDSWFELLQFLYNPEANNSPDYRDFHPGYY